MLHFHLKLPKLDHFIDVCSGCLIDDDMKVDMKCFFSQGLSSENKYREWNKMDWYLDSPHYFLNLDYASPKS